MATEKKTAEASIAYLECLRVLASLVVLLRSLVEGIQIFHEITEDGRIIKSIKLCVPVVYENETTPKISWDKLTPVESIACLCREQVDD